MLRLRGRGSCRTWRGVPALSNRLRYGPRARGGLGFGAVKHDCFNDGNGRRRPGHAREVPHAAAVSDSKWMRSGRATTAAASECQQMPGAKGFLEGCERQAFGSLVRSSIPVGNCGSAGCDVVRKAAGRLIGRLHADDAAFPSLRSQVSRSTAATQPSSIPKSSLKRPGCEQTPSLPTPCCSLDCLSPRRHPLPSLLTGPPQPKPICHSCRSRNLTK